jgi:hypothetical protein
MKKLIFPFILLIVILLFGLSCGPYVKKPVASHVVAVTLEGDTILVAIDKIRPNMYMNFYPVYSSYSPYYPNQYYSSNNYRFRYSNNTGKSRSVKTYKVTPSSGGTTYSPGSEKSISRLDYEKPIKRSKD